MKSLSYACLARNYDNLMFDVDYEGWAGYIDGVLKKAGVPEKGRVLETACGTGAITSLLYKRGYDVTAADVSGEMLNLAVQKTRAAGQRINFLLMDMAELDFENRFDAVVTACDGVNYLNLDQLSSYAGRAYRALKPGGALTFDMSTVNKLKDELGNNVFCDEDDNCAYIWKNAYLNGVCSIELSLYIKREDGLFERRDEYHELHAFDEQTVYGLLCGAGFSGVAVQKGDGLPITSGRVQFTALKPL